jgi:hypothetical protein
MTAIPASVWANADVRLRVWFNDGTNGSQLLTPDQRLAPTGYLPDGSVAAAAIASGAVTSTKIANGAVGSTQIAAGAVANAQLANSGITITDVATLPNGKAKIGSIVSGGPVLGLAGTNVTFGFISREIGSFKYQGIALALTAGAGNDSFDLGKAQAVGPSLSNSNLVPDGFAVHVFEV